MGIVFPNEVIARHWNGALQARLRRVPLEDFLRVRGIDPAPAGVARDTDNLVRATVSLVEAALVFFFEGREEGLEKRHQAALGRVTCLVSRALAQLIAQPTAWRTVALVSIARVLTPWIGLNAAALASASYTRLFEQSLPKGISAMDVRVGQRVLCAVAQEGAAALAEMSAAISMQLRCTDIHDPAQQQHEPCEVSAEVHAPL